MATLSLTIPNEAIPELVAIYSEGRAEDDPMPAFDFAVARLSATLQRLMAERLMQYRREQATKAALASVDTELPSISVELS